MANAHYLYMFISTRRSKTKRRIAFSAAYLPDISAMMLVINSTTLP